MNLKPTLILGAVLGLCPAQAADEKVNIDQLPAPVRQAIESSRKQDPVKQVKRRQSEGRTVYVVEIERNNAPNPVLQIADDGTLLREPLPVYTGTADVPVVPSEYGDAAAAMPRRQLSDLPPAVQETARSEAKGRDVVDIDRETWHGRLVYEIEFRDRGLNSRIYVADDGTLVRDERPARGLKSLFLGTQLEDTPAPVQEAIRRLAGDREIADIDQRGAGPDPVYRVEIREPQGRREVHITSAGKVVFDTHGTRPARGN